MSLRMKDVATLVIIAMVALMGGYVMGLDHKYERIMSELPALLEAAGCLTDPPSEGAF